MKLDWKQELIDLVKAIVAEIKTCLQLMVSARHLWIFAPSLLAVFTSYLAHALDWQVLLIKGNQEVAALWLMGGVVVIMWLGVAVRRTPLIIYLAILASCFLLRELDATWMTVPYWGLVKFQSKDFMNNALAVLIVWGCLWHRKLLPILPESVYLKLCFLATFLTYAMSQAIARRFFKHIPILPNEQHMHIILEEITEDYAHFCFLILAILLLVYHRKAASRGTEDLELSTREERGGE